jgi:TFIIF-interacting CTD phosphatase-like protein
MGRMPTQTEMQDLLPEIVFNIRPHTTQFLYEMSRYFEIVIFTAADQSVSTFFLIILVCR